MIVFILEGRFLDPNGGPIDGAFFISGRFCVPSVLIFLGRSGEMNMCFPVPQMGELPLRTFGKILLSKSHG